MEMITIDIIAIFGMLTTTAVKLTASQTCGGLGNNTVGHVRTRIGCQEVLYCSGVGSGVEWRRFGARIPLGDGTNRTITSSSVLISGNRTEHCSTITFDPVDFDDSGRYTCFTSGETAVTTNTVSLIVLQEPVAIDPPVPNMNIREFQVGQTLTVPCSICTCQEIEAAELFKDNQLLFSQPVAVDRTSSLCSVHRFQLELSDDSAGSYACSVTIAETSVLQVFTIVGAPLPPPGDSRTPTSIPLPTSIKVLPTSIKVLPTSTTVVPQGPSPVAIVGGAIGGVALIVLTAVGVGIFFCAIFWRRKQAKAKPSGAGNTESIPVEYNKAYTTNSANNQVPLESNKAYTPNSAERIPLEYNEAYATNATDQQIPLEYNEAYTTEHTNMDYYVNEHDSEYAAIDYYI